MKTSGAFRRKMESRHLIMLSLGGVIGTGLFLSTGYTLEQAGRVGTILSYLIGAVVVYLVMLSLGELAVHMPETGSFHKYATKYIGPGTGYTVAWLYWLTWTVALGSEFTAAGILMQRWFPSIPVWVFSALFAAMILGINVLKVRVFAEVEFWFSAIKVVTIIAFILLGAGAIVGFIPLQDGSPAPFFSSLTEGGLFPNGAFVIFMTMLAVNFAYSGTELIGVAAGEAVDPKRTIPLAIRTTIFATRPLLRRYDHRVSRLIANGWERCTRKSVRRRVRTDRNSLRSRRDELRHFDSDFVGSELWTLRRLSDALVACERTYDSTLLRPSDTKWGSTSSCIVQHAWRRTCLAV